MPGPPGPARREQQLCVKGEGKTCSMQTEVQRPEQPGWSMDRSFEESSVYLQFFFLMGGWAAKLVVMAMRGLPALLPALLYSVSPRSGGCRWHGESQQ